jgi:DNA-binding CsgD family transcriptional regulator
VAAALETVAERALRRGGIAVAVAAYTRAGQLSQAPRIRTRFLLRAAELACELGRRDVVENLLAQVAGTDLSPVDAGRMLVVHETIQPGGHAWDRRRLHELVRGAQTVDQAEDRDLALNLLWTAAARVWWTSPPAQDRDLVTEAANAMTGSETDLRLLAVRTYADPARHAGTVLAVAAGTEVTSDVRTLFMVGSAALIVTDYRRATTLLAATAAAYRTQGRLGQLARTLANGGWSALYTGDWDFARTAAEEGRQLAEEAGEAIWVSAATGVRAMHAALRGDSQQAEALGLVVMRTGPPAGALWQHGLSHQIRGVAAIGAGRHEDAFDHLRRMFDPQDPAYHYFLRLSAIPPLAEAARRSNNTDAARAIVADLEPLAGQTLAPYFQVGMRYARAVLAEDDAAEALFAEALGADLEGWPMDHGRLLLAYGEWLRRRRQPADSREPLRAARDLLDSLGARPWADRARTELRATGEASRSRTDRGRDLLSPQELQVAELVAAGLTNREIGDQLFLSRRTVGSHLYRIFPKLGITSRAELAAALATAYDSVH